MSTWRIAHKSLRTIQIRRYVTVWIGRFLIKLNIPIRSLIIRISRRFWICVGGIAPAKINMSSILYPLNQRH